MEIATTFDLIDYKTTQKEGDDKRVNFEYLHMYIQCYFYNATEGQGL